MVDRVLIRVYGDSLSMPRRSEGVDYFQTYPELLVAAWRGEALGHEITIYNRSYADASTAHLLRTYRSDAFYFGNPGGSVGILQCGIVDCAPRPIPPKIRSIVSRMPTSVREKIVSFIHANRASMLRSGLMWRTTPPKRFLETMTALVRMAAPDFSRFYVINIAPTVPAIEARSPGLSESIRYYNSLIEKAVSAVASPNVRIIDVYGLILNQQIDRFISPLDGHHISAEAHRLYAEAILEHERQFWQR